MIENLRNISSKHANTIKICGENTSHIWAPRLLKINVKLQHVVQSFIFIANEAYAKYKA